VQWLQNGGSFYTRKQNSVQGAIARAKKRELAAAEGSETLSR